MMAGKPSAATPAPAARLPLRKSLREYAAIDVSFYCRPQGSRHAATLPRLDVVVRSSIADSKACTGRQLDDLSQGRRPGGGRALRKSWADPRVLTRGRE